jgi:hypothetical protein
MRTVPVNDQVRRRADVVDKTEALRIAASTNAIAGPRAVYPSITIYL